MDSAFFTISLIKNRNHRCTFAQLKFEVMKNTLSNILLVTVSLVYLSCTTNKLSNPENIGLHAMEILKMMDAETQDSYAAKFMSVSEIKEVSEKKAVISSEETRQEMRDIKEGPWMRRIYKDFNEIKAFAITNGIDWPTIEYSGWSFETLDMDGVHACKGDLYFISNGRTYMLEIYSVFNGEEYRLVEVEDIRPES